MVALPSATAVTRPTDDTVAMDELAVAAVTVGPANVLSVASFTAGTLAAVTATDTYASPVRARVPSAAS